MTTTPAAPTPEQCIAWLESHVDQGAKVMPADSPVYLPREYRSAILAILRSRPGEGMAEALALADELRHMGVLMALPDAVREKFHQFYAALALPAAGGEAMKHERRAVGHINGRIDYLDTCRCGKPWPCPDLPAPIEPRSVQRRIAAQKCEPAPTFETPLDLLLWAMGEGHSPDRLEEWDERKYKPWFWWQAELRRRFAAIDKARGEEPTPADYEEVLADNRRLTRELDVLLNGDGAAKQAALCDIVAQVEIAVRKLGRPLLSAPSLEDAPVPEFSCDDDGALTIEWYRSHTSVLTVSSDDSVGFHFAAATGPGITSSGCWELGQQPPQSFYDAYRAVVGGAAIDAARTKP